MSPVQQKRPRRHRAVARAVVVRGAFRVGVAFLSASFLGTSCRPSPPLHFAVLEPPVGRSRRHRSCRRFRRASSYRTRPQTLPLHCARASLHIAAPPPDPRRSPGRGLRERLPCRRGVASRFGRPPYAQSPAIPRPWRWRVGNR